jgi:sucrose phosphorylase
VIKLLRDVLETVEPAALIMTETNVPHAENVSYFGDGDEAHLIYQFSLPPLLLHALHAGSSAYLNAWAKELEADAMPPGCTYLNFTASHDGVGLRPLEGLVPRDEVDRLLERMRERGGYISSKSNSDGSESPYELNISYFDAFRDPAGDNRWHIPMFMVSQIIALSFKGIPAVYIHCLTATPNDTLGVERTGMTRSINRRKWDKGELEYQICDLASETGQVFALYRRLLTLRRAQPAFHPNGAQRIVEIDDQVFCFERSAPDDGQHILVLTNLSPHSLKVPSARLPADLARREELLKLSTPTISDHMLLLEPYATFWFSRHE